MKKILDILLLILILVSCKANSKKAQNEIEHILSNIVLQDSQLDSINLTPFEIDSLVDKGKLFKKFYPNMSVCGGGIDGYYYKGNLKLIDAYYGAELGYASRKVYWRNNEIIKIVYREHFPEEEKYLKKYPLDKFEFDPSKMTYSDTIYEITFDDPLIFKKIAGKRVISTNANTVLVHRLLNCGKRMKEELESIKD